ncbi:MAG: hypothetical protein ACYTDY_15725, partial [Planctomycetota bacterium]
MIMSRVFGSLYGPLLGPLVVGLAAFRVPAEAGDVRSLLPGTADRSGPAPVDDSKVLYRGPGGLATLERTVLAFRTLCASAEVPDPPRETPPWGLAYPPDLPVAATEEEIEAARTALAAESEASGVLLLDLRTRTVGVEELNGGIEEHGTKAAVLFDAAMELAAPWLDEPGETEIFVDRHGGRSHYSPLLVTRFAGRHHWIVGEDRETSTYRFPGEGGDVTMAFEVDGDARHLPTALASMAAKYVRELHMRA